MENTLKQKLAAGAQPIGTFFDTASVSLMECLGRTGLDFAIIDNEHSPIEAETTAALVRAAELRSLSLEVPFACRLSLELQAAGVPVSTCITDDTLKEELCALRSKM